MGINDQNDELQRKLDHYNKWLMDNDREFGVPYPGYPGDKKKTKAEKAVVTPKPTKKGASGMKIQSLSTTKAANTRVLRGPKTGTKQSAAVAIVRKLGVSAKHEAISAIMEDLSMSLAGATTYFHNAKKVLLQEQA